MAESSSCVTETKEAAEEGCSNVSLFQKRTEFHPPTIPSPLETLNPNSNDSNKASTKIQSGEVFNNGGGVLNPNSNDSRKSTTNGTAFSSKGKNQNGRIFENGLNPKLNFTSSLGKIGAGLENLGNTCFLNSVLQCLTYTEPFAAYLQSGKHKRSCQVAGFCALCAIQNHVRCALQSTGRTLAPKYLVTNIRCISQNFSYARQEDAHEYMVSLLESMHKCCLPLGLPSVSPIAYEKSLVHKIFGGRLRSQVKCTECSYGSNKYDPFLDLSLEIAKADSLRKALKHFTAVEQLDGGEKQYQCQQCKQKVRAVRQLTIHKPPYVLTIHLKRFGSLIPGQKINKKIEFGPTLDLKPFVSGTYEGDLKYTLYGVLVHAGWSTHSGHYYCFVRTASGMWHVLDDNEVLQVKVGTVLEQKAYMLFYVRDRRNLAPKKPIDFSPKRPVDVVQKENSVVHHVENKECPISILGRKETVQNDMLTIGSTTSVSSPVLTNVDAVASGSGEESILKIPSSFKTKVPLIVSSPASIDSIESSLEKVLNVVSVHHFTNNHTRVESLPQTASSVSSVVESGHTVSHPCCASTSVKNKAADGHEETMKELTVPVSTLPVCKSGHTVSHPYCASTSAKNKAADEHEESMKELTVPVATLPVCKSGHTVSHPYCASTSVKNKAADGLEETMEEFTVPVVTLPVCKSGHTVSHPCCASTNVKTKAADEHEETMKELTVPVDTLPVCKIVREFSSKTTSSATNMEHENVSVIETISSKALCESLPNTVSSVVKGGGTISHFYGSCTSAETKATNEHEAKVINNHITAETSAIDMVNENASLSETVPSKSPCKSLPETTSLLVESGGTISHLYGACMGANTKTVMHEEADNNHITLEGLPLLASSIAKDGVIISHPTVMKTKAINEHEESMKDLTPVDTPLDLNAELSKTSSTNMEHEIASVNDTVPSEALCVVSELSPQEVGSMRLSSQPDTEQRLCKRVSDFGPALVGLVQLSSQLGTKEALCTNASDLGLAEDSMLLSSRSSLEGTLCKGVSDVGRGEVGSTKLSNQWLTEEAPGKRIKDLADGEVGSMPLSSQQGTEDGQNDGFVIESGSSDWQNEEENGLRSDEILSVNTSTQSCMENRSDQNEPLDHFHHQKVLKPKKRLMKFQAASTNLSSSLLFRASLCAHRKKKRKRSKIRSLEYDKSTQKEFREESVFEMEASTSEPQKWQGDSVANNIHGKTTARNVMDTFDSVHDFMNILTRGLEETTVARWNGIGPHPSKIQGLSNTESISIGYVPDEWDVEYDRGKRKNGLGRPNSFQESAMMKNRLKKAKIDRSSSGNRPFRI